MAIWPTIEDPQADPVTHQGILRSMKNVIEMITGQRSAPIAVMRQNVQPLPPGVGNSPIAIQQLRQGDMWINTSANYKLNFWDDSIKGWRATS